MLGEPSFGDLIWLYPLATALHVLEEWPGFPRWARRFASPRYSDREYVLTHLLTIVVAVTTATLLHLLPRPVLVLGFFALLGGPATFWNALFHAGASLWTRSYCPGTLTGLLLYVPLFVSLGALALREELVTGRSLVAALSIAMLVHVAEVGHTVFKRW